jgi:hypothetical protein
VLGLGEPGQEAIPQRNSLLTLRIGQKGNRIDHAIEVVFGRLGVTPTGMSACLGVAKERITAGNPFWMKAVTATRWHLRCYDRPVRWCWAQRTRHEVGDEYRATRKSGSLGHAPW